MQKLRLSQGLLGADSMKPTELLALNLPNLPAAKNSVACHPRCSEACEHWP